MDTRRELRTGLRLLIMALVFLAMSCESDGDGGDCLGSTDQILVGCTSGCGSGMRITGQGCLGECLMGSNDGCGAGEGCAGDCMGDCFGDCDAGAPHAYTGDVVEGAIQIHVTDSLFDFVHAELKNIILAAIGDMLDPLDYKRRCDEGTETWDCGNAEKWLTYCLAPVSVDIPVLGSAGICHQGRNCNVEGDLNGPNNGCKIHLILGEPTLTTSTSSTGTLFEVKVVLDELYANMYANLLGTCWLEIGKVHKNNPELSATIGLRLRVNPVDGNTELYVGADTIHLNLSGLQDKSNCFATNISGGIKGILNTALNNIGGITCRGCKSNADCGAGSTCGAAGACTAPSGSGQFCAGLQLGADMLLDAAPMLSAIDAGAEGRLSLRAFMGSYVSSNLDGLQLGGRLGATAPVPSLCVPVRPSPIQPGKEDCRTGSECKPLAQLNDSGKIHGDTFHIGAGVAMGGLNQILWSAYSSGLLCLSVGGETPGLEMLSTNLVSAFVNSLSSLTYGVDQAIMLQIRPQQAPVVDFQPDVGQGAQLIVKLPELELDFYTVVDNRYARIFTLGASIELPLGVKGSDTKIEIAIGDLANVIDPATVTVSNVEMVSRAQVESLVKNIPTLIGALTGVLGDDLIPPIDLAELMGDIGIGIKFVGPGLTIIEEGGKAAALGVFVNMDVDPEDLGGLFPNMEPHIASLDIDVRDPNELRADLAARRRADQSFSYTDLMPRVVATMDVLGADLDANDAEFAYSINNGPWSFWKRGPMLTIDNPILAMESKFDVRIAARVAGNMSSGSDKVATFSFVNDYSAPTVEISADGSSVSVVAFDKVYNKEELLMQYRLNGGAWSSPGAVENLDILPQLLEGQVVVDVLVADPSGNSRTVRRTFGAAATSSTNAASPVASGAEGGCSTSQGSGGLLAIFALLGLVVARRRESASSVAASPSYIGLAILVILMLGMSTMGCKKNQPGAVCDPVCDSASICQGGVCMPMACNSDDDCALKDRCVDGFCKANMACESSDDCEHGHICKDGTCKPSECSDHPDCSATSCPDGKLPYCDYDDYQSVEAGECVCESGAEMGRHGGWLNVVAFDEDESVIALAYSEQYGDLILGDLQDDGLFTWTFIDGVPNGPVDRPPSGVRNGIIAVGDDAGRYVSVAVETLEDGGAVLHTAYQYRVSGQSNSVLRYARGVRDGAAWNWTQIDVDDLDVNGNFPSVFLTRTDAVLDDEGTELSPAGGGVGIVYMIRDIAYEDTEVEGAAAQYFTEVWAAYANTLAPSEAADFQLSEIAQAENPILCGGLCDSKALCATDLNRCVARGSGCSTCGEGESCVKADGETLCMKTTAPTTGGLSAIPRGIGLFSSTAVDAAGIVHTAFYDQVHGNLNYAQLSVADGTPTTVFGPLIVDGESDGRSTGDVGRWTRIHTLDSGGVVVFYEDAGRAELRAAVIDGANVKITVLDNGKYNNLDSTQVQSNRVGASIFSRALETGGFEVYYQDATNAVVRRVVWTDLNQAPQEHAYAVFGSEAGLARELTGSAPALDAAEMAVANGNGALGFFVNVVESGGRTLFVSKHVSSPVGNSRSVEMNVRTGSVVHPVIDEEEGEDATP